MMKPSQSIFYQKSAEHQASFVYISQTPELRAFGVKDSLRLALPSFLGESE